MGKVWAWFAELSVLAKCILIFGVIVISIAAAPVTLVISSIVLPLALIWLLIVALTHKPVAKAAILSGGSFVAIIIFAVLTGVFYGGGEGTQEVAQASQTKENTTEETTSVSEEPEPEAQAVQVSDEVEPERTPQVAEKTAREETKPAPEPLTPEQALTKRIKKSTGIPKEITALKVKETSQGCFNVSVNFTAEGIWDSRAYVEATEDSMYWIYEAAYKSGNPPVCNVATNGYSSFVDKYGNASQKRTYSTEMNAATGQKINWNYVLTEEVAALWTETYVSPMFKQQKAENQARRAVDCMKDDGLFDFDLDC